MDDTYLGQLPSRRWRLPRAGFPVGDVADTMSIEELRARLPSLIDGHVVLPALVIKRSALTNNLGVMRMLTSQPGVSFAPHAKTTMAPQLMRLQLDAGACGVTVANVFQASVARLAGARQILIANEVVGDQDIGWLARMTRDETTTVTVQVDSPEAVATLDGGLDRARLGERQDVLIEVGHVGGRTGARDVKAALATADAIAGAVNLRLIGVATYEGVVGHDRETATLARVDDFLDGVKAITIRLAERASFDGLDRVLVSAGGTRFVDRVVERLAPGDWNGCEVNIIVRAGGYLTYGHEAGPNDTPFSTPRPFGQLIPVLELWAEVLSLPEAGLAIVGVGKRNVGDRPGAIVPTQIVQRGGAPGPTETMNAIAGQLTVTGLDDQHAYVTYRDMELRLGDLVGFSLPYPTTLDRWRVVPVVDERYQIVDAVATSFA